MLAWGAACAPRICKTNLSCQLAEYIPSSQRLKSTGFLPRTACRVGSRVGHGRSLFFCTGRGLCDERLARGTGPAHAPVPPAHHLSRNQSNASRAPRRAGPLTACGVCFHASEDGASSFPGRRLGPLSSNTPGSLLLPAPIFSFPPPGTPP